MKQIFFTIGLIIFCSSILRAQPGILDKMFGDYGIVLDKTLYNSNCLAMAVQADGKILTGGFTEDSTNINENGGFYIARYNNDGSPDNTFGVKGKFIIRKIQSYTALWPKTIAVQPDNKIVVCGKFTLGYYGDVGLIRLMPDGTLDQSFGSEGFVATSVSAWQDVIGGMILQQDGKIVVAGNKEVDFKQPGPDFILRYMPNGSLDNSFGDKGLVLTSYTSNVTLGAVALQPDGKIVTGGTYGVSTIRYQLVRYKIDGKLDSEFGDNGIARLTPSSGYFARLNSLAIQDDGKILAAGLYGASSMALARFNLDGSVDDGFGDHNGYTYFYTPSVVAEAKSVFFQKNKILITGFYSHTPAEQIAIVAYTENGAIDSSFGTNGIATGGFPENKNGSDVSSGYGVLQPDGKIVVSGCFLQDNDFFYNVGLFRFYGTENKELKYVKIKHWLHKHGFTWEDWPGKNNISYYTVERSSNCNSFNAIGQLFRNSTGQYSFEDATPLPSNNFYRVGAVSSSGNIRYSNVLNIPNTNAVTVYPNPTKNSIKISSLSATNKTTLRITDLVGNIKAFATITASNYNWNISSLPSGNYVLQIIDSDGNSITKKILKE